MNSGWFSPKCFCHHGVDFIGSITALVWGVAAFQDLPVSPLMATVTVMTDFLSFFAFFRDDGVGWISINSPIESEETENDVIGLQQSWEQLKDSGRPVCLQTITELAHTHQVLTGKWLFYVSTGLKVDHVWSLVSRATLQESLGHSTKVSSFMGGDRTHVICIYNRDFTNTEEVLQLENRIRAVGIKCQLLYKPDVYTYLGIYRNNSWGLRPTIHESVFDLATNCSKVTSVQ